MAGKKIGAYITLDGEKEFRQDVTNCNKALTTLKSEMSLVKAESEGQANSLESLRKKHEVLTKTLETHKRKEEAIQAGLDHAKESYNKVGEALGDYKTKLQSAKDELENMQQNSETTDEELEKQKATVAELSDIVEKGEQTYKKAGNKIEEWQTKLNTARAQTIKATGALNENAAYMNEAQKATDRCATSIDEFGKKAKEVSEVTVDLSTIIKANLCDTAIDAVKNGAQEVKQVVTETETSMKQLQASTGLTSQEIEKYKESMDSLYENNYGDSLEDIADSMSLVKQYTNETDPSKIEQLTENGLAMRDVFDIELSESIRGADALMDNFGKDSEEAFDLMAKAAQNGLDKSGELADNIAEYGALWAQAGFEAEEMFTIMQNGLDSGAYNLDKVNDFVKEFGNSLADGRIKDNLGSFSAETQNLFYQWQSGKATTKDVFYSVVNDLNTATNKQEMLTLASNTWSSLGEDNALKVITSLADVNNAYDDVKGTMEKIKSVKYDTLESRVQQLGRKVMSGFVQPVAEKALPKIEKGLDAVIEHTDTLIPLTETAIAGLLTYKVASVAISAYEAATEAATISQVLLNTAMNANPAALVTAGIVAAGVALVSFAGDIEVVKTESEELRESAETMIEEMQQSQTELRDSIASTKETVETSVASVEAMRPAAEELALLAKQESYSNEEYDRMVNLVTQLKTIYPEMGIEIDSVTGKLNMSSEEIEKYINNLENMAEAEAYQQGMQESMDAATQAIKERTLVEDKLNEVLGEQHDVEKDINTIEVELEKRSQLALKSQEELNEMLEEGIITQEDYTRTLEHSADQIIEYKGEQRFASEVLSELTREQQENKKVIDDLTKTIDGHNETIKDAQEQSEIYAEKYNELTAQVEADTAAEQANAEAVAAASKASIEVAGQELEAYSSLSAEQQQLAVDVTNSVLTMQDSVQSAVQSQMDIFSEFDSSVEISTSKLLENMQSQVDGVTQWESNLAALMDQTKTTADGTAVAIDEGLVQYLASLGPEGAGYVQAFVEMSGDELAKANGLWQEKVAIESFTNEAGEKLTQGIGTLSAGGVEAFNQLGEDLNMQMNESGTYGVQGLVDGMVAAQTMAEKVSEDLGAKVIDSLNEGLGCHSPSVKAKESGENTDQGLIDGINAKLGLVRVTGKNLGSTAIKGLESSNMYSRAYSLGADFGDGFKNGIESKASEIAQQAASVVRGAITAAKKEQNSNSPAKETIKLGHDFGDGEVIGIRDKIPDVSEASADMVDAALLAQDSRWAAGTTSGGIYNRTSEVNAIIAESMELSEGKTRMSERYGLLPNTEVGFDCSELAGVLKESMEEMVTKVIKNAKISLSIDGRNADRVLKDRGVVYAW